MYKFIEKKERKSIKYYQSILDNFKDDAEIYLAYIHPEKYLRLSKENYEKELDNNEKYNELLQEKTRRSMNVSKIINAKMESDKKLGLYQEHLNTATRIFQNHPDGIIIGGAIIIKYDKGINLVIEGFNKKYSSYNPNYLLKWELIKKFNNSGYNYFNLNGITGEFNKTNKYSGLNEMKLGFNASAIEYIGEFDLIINKTVNSIYNHKKKKEI